MFKKKTKFTKNEAFYVIRMLENIPKDLLYIFSPGNDDELLQFEINIIRWLKKSQDRVKIMRLQKQHNLPLRPNQSLRDVLIRINILTLNKRQEFDANINYPPYDDKDSNNV